MFSKFNEETQKVLLMAKKEMLELKHPYVGSEHLLLSILHNSLLDVTKFLNSCGISYDNFKNEIVNIIGIGSSTNEWFLYTPLLKRIIENAILDSKDDNSEVTVEKLFLSLLEEGDGVANRILMGMNIDIDALYDKYSTKFLYKNRSHSTKLLIDEYGVDFNKKAMDGDFDPVIGRDEKINRIIEILLRRTKNNPLLIGEAGVGKTALVEELANRIVKGLVPTSLKNKRIISISMASMVSGTKYRGEFEERIGKIIDEVEEDDNIILFIDEIHTMVGAGGAEGAIDASNILKPYLARGKIKLIGATTRAEYAKYLESDKALDRRFQKIYVEEADLEQTKNILLNLKSIYEDYHGIKIGNDIIDDIVYLSDRYISNSKQPDKAIDLLDEACTKTLLLDSCYDKKIKRINLEINRLREEKNKAIIDHNFKLASELKECELFNVNKLNKLELKTNKNDVQKEISKDILYDVIYNKTGIPIKKINNMNKKAIVKELNKSVIGQEKLIEKVVTDCLIARKMNKLSPSAFLLVGKTGVGKTFMVREYAKTLYPKEAFIKIDMSEYRESNSFTKIIGSNPGYVGYDDKNTILDKVKLNPYSVILLDEIEKAHPSVLKLFLQVLDDGYMTNSIGEKINFKNTVIFMTSNIGTLSNSVGFLDNRKNIIIDRVKQFLGIELVNRLDDIIIFNNLDEKSINKIIHKKINDFVLNNKIGDVNEKELFEEVKNECNYLEFGARRIDKIIASKFKDIIAATK